MTIEIIKFIASFILTVAFFYVYRKVGRQKGSNMINDKKIIEAAIQNAEKYNPCRSTLDREEVCRASFEDGVEWLKQAIWHERDEEPTEEGVIIKRLAKNGEIYLTFSNWVKVKNDIIESQKEYGSTQDQIALCVRIAWKECGNFDNWCYLADLLPKGGEND